MRERILLLIILLGANKGDAQTNDNRGEFHDTKVVVTGVLLVSDWRCEEHRAKGKWSGVHQMVCPDRLVPTDWGLVSGRNQYLLLGDAAKFKKYERSRVTISGLANGRTIAVDSVTPTRVTDREILDLIEELRVHPWDGPGNQTITIHWFFNFTDPMLKILEAGLPAGDLLLQYWHHGGGISIDACPDDPKSCWSAWWTKNKGAFRVTARTVDRAYSNYPNYGIYQQP